MGKKVFVLVPELHAQHRSSCPKEAVRDERAHVHALTGVHFFIYFFLVLKFTCTSVESIFLFNKPQNLQACHT